MQKLTENLLPVVTCACTVSSRFQTVTETDRCHKHRYSVQRLKTDHGANINYRIIEQLVYCCINVYVHVFYYINMNNVQFSQRIPGCQRCEFRFFFQNSQPNNQNKHYPTQVAKWYGKGKNRSLDDFDPEFLTLYSLRQVPACATWPCVTAVLRSH